MAFRITTWNVNGIRNPFGYQPWREKRTFQAMFDILEADIVIMQETKIQRKDLRDDMVLVPGWDVFFSLPKHKKGYSGVAIYTRNATCAPIRAEEGVTGILCPPKSSTAFRDLPQDQQIGGYPRPGQLDGLVDEATLDSEGRCVILEFPAFVLFGVYSPANRDESRDEFRISFVQALDVRIRNLVAEGKQVILTGDLNIVRSQIDSTNLAETLRKEGISMDDWMNTPARRIFNHLIYEGSVIGPRDDGREEPVLWDLCRCFHPERQGMNTCWDTKRNTRPANNGSRIDYVLCSDGIKDWFTHADIQEGLMGSDHCPVFATLADSVRLSDKDVPVLERLNPPDMFQDGQRIRDWSGKDLLPLSARLIPEFDGRRSIRDMFTKTAASNQPRHSSATAETIATPPDARPVDQSNTSQRHDTTATSQIAIISSRPANSAMHKPRPQPPPKRPADVAESGSTRTLKRSRSAAGGNDAKAKVSLGQTTLRGFFSPKPSASASPSSATERATPTTRLSAASTTTTAPEQDARSASSAARPERDLPQTCAPDPGKVFDPIQAKESWSKLLSKRVAPLCEHDEPCISLTTKKPGVNCGRSFYICPRPLGPSGEKEKGSEWRCGTFIWSSDWSGTSV